VLLGKQIQVGLVVDSSLRGPSGLAVPTRELINGLVKLSNEDFRPVCLSLKRALKLSSKDIELIHVPHVTLGLKEKVSEAFSITHERLLITIHALGPAVMGNLFYYSKEDEDSDRARLEGDLQLLRQQHERLVKIITVSESMRQQIIDYLGIPREKIAVIYHGVDHSLFHPTENRNDIFGYLRNNYGLRDSPYILHVSHGYPLKNIPRMLRAYEESKEKGVRHQLVIVGPQPDAMRELAGKIDGVLLTGPLPHEELVNFYCCADFLLHPSLYESFSITILEAMACGTPIVTSNCFAMPEIAGGAALYVDPLDVDSISNAITRISGDMNLKNSLREIGLKRSELFSWERCAQEHLLLYHSLASERGRSTDLSIDKLAILNLLSIYDLRQDLQTAFPDGDKNLSSLINWAVEVQRGADQETFLLKPYEKWYKEHHKALDSISKRW